MTPDQTEQPIKMPKLGLTMTEATLVRWLKTEGEPVSPGEILFEFESDKSLMEYETPAAGVLGRFSSPREKPCLAVRPWPNSR